MAVYFNAYDLHSYILDKKIVTCSLFELMLRIAVNRLRLGVVNIREDRLEDIKLLRKAGFVLGRVNDDGMIWYIYERNLPAETLRIIYR